MQYGIISIKIYLFTTSMFCFGTQCFWVTYIGQKMTFCSNIYIVSVHKSQKEISICYALILLRSLYVILKYQFILICRNNSQGFRESCTLRTISESSQAVIVKLVITRSWGSTLMMRCLNCLAYVDLERN